MISSQYFWFQMIRLAAAETTSLSQLLSQGLQPAYHGQSAGQNRSLNPLEFKIYLKVKLVNKKWYI